MAFTGVDALISGGGGLVWFGCVLLWDRFLLLDPCLVIGGVVRGGFGFNWLYIVLFHAGLDTEAQVLHMIFV